MPIVMACIQYEQAAGGALIVMEHNLPLDEVLQSGEVINADVNQRLLENIFFKNSPLHDGAVVIGKGRIRAAGCILPVAQPRYSLRNWGYAIGLPWEFLNNRMHTPSLSEETGAISVAYRGQFYLRLSAEELESLLTKDE